MLAFDGVSKSTSMMLTVPAPSLPALVLRLENLIQLGLYRLHGIAADTAGAVDHKGKVVVLAGQHHAAVQIPTTILCSLP